MSLRQRLERDLVDAMRRRESTEVKTIRLLMSAMENAAAVDAPPENALRLGLGHDVPPLQLSPDEVLRVMTEEREDLAKAAEQYRGLGQDAHADEFDRRVAIVDRYLTQ